MKDLQKRRGTAIILITHDLGVVAGMSDRVHVMYAGKLVETGGVSDLFRAPAHPYTAGLLGSVPRLNSDTNRMTSAPLLDVRDLHKHFPVGQKGLFGGHKQLLKAVNGVSFTLERGQCLGLVGESGCGKSTVARAVVGLHPATSGSIQFDGHELAGLSTRGWLPYRRKIQMIFQDPYASLDPRQTVSSILTEPTKIHGVSKPRERKLHAMQLLEAVGLNPRHINRYPHEFSGGQRQRIGIARALALEPELLICDEPVSALDVSIQAQIINLMGELKERFNLSYLFIAHDLAVVRHICDAVAVMYLGRVVEQASRDEIFNDPQHPYTKSLLS
ncbi:UNVERIFIED_CONTAM: hypothetical protein GTU68_035667, partial [Idotea baltica]|nr:hypothetical protein [Idotea baltica]